MGNKAVFLDRDGTINVDKHYLFRKEDFVFLPDVLPAMRLFQEKGYLLVVVTNQSGIGRGYYTEEDLLSLNRWMMDRLQREGIVLSGIYYCPHLPDAPVEQYRRVCDCRKPGTGLYHRAAEELDIDLSKSIVVGDKMRDLTLADEIPGCRAYLVGNEITLLDVAKKA